MRVTFILSTMKIPARWAFAGVLTGIILYMQLCGTKEITEAQIKESVFFKQLEQKVRDTSMYYETLLKADSINIDLAVAQAERSSEKVLLYESQLIDTRTLLGVLSQQLKLARKDTTDKHKWVSVSPRYVNACDSFEIVAMEQDQRLGGYLVENKKLAADIFIQKTAFEKALDNQKKFNRALQFQLDTCLDKGKTVEALPERRTQVYLGANLYGNKQDIISGGQVCLTLLTKKRTMFEVNGLLINDRIHVGAGTKILISFRRK
jgi:hypothetical protein